MPKETRLLNALKKHLSPETKGLRLSPEEVFRRFCETLEKRLADRAPNPPAVADAGRPGAGGAP